MEQSPPPMTAVSVNPYLNIDSSPPALSTHPRHDKNVSGFPSIRTFDLCTDPGSKLYIPNSRVRAPQAGVCLKSRDILDVGSTVTLRWNASSRYPTVTLVLWDPSPDGLYVDLGSLDDITNLGRASWTVIDAVGPHILGIGVGMPMFQVTLTSGSPGALGNSSGSEVFTIRRPLSSTSTSSSTIVSQIMRTSSTAATVDFATTTFTGTPANTPTFASAGSSVKKDDIQVFIGLVLFCIISLLASGIV